MRAPRRWWSCLAALVASCTTEGIREADEASGGIPATTVAEASGSEGEAGEGAATSSDSPSFDVGDGESATMGGSEGTPQEGCEAVDFLFVIDNSASMENKQAALVGAFPQFMAAIEQAIPSNDYHVL